MKTLYATSYKLNGTVFANQLYAEDHSVKSICALRGLREEVKGVSTIESLRPEKYLELVNDLKSDQLLHLMIFCCWVGIKAKDITIDEALSDFGVLHELMHIREFDRVLSGTKEDLQEKLRTIIKQAYSI